MQSLSFSNAPLCLYLSRNVMVCGKSQRRALPKKRRAPAPVLSERGKSHEGVSQKPKNTLREVLKPVRVIKPEKGIKRRRKKKDTMKTKGGRKKKKEEKDKKSMDRSRN